MGRPPSRVTSMTEQPAGRSGWWAPPSRSGTWIVGIGSGHTQLLLEVGARGRVAEDQPLLGAAVAERLLAHQGRLVEAGEDQLQLAGVGADVADGEDALLARLEGFRLDLDQVLVEVEAPVGHGAKLHLQAVEGEERVGGHPLLPARALHPD